MSIDAQLSHGEKVRKDLNVYRRSLSVGGVRQILTRSRSGDRELQGPVSRRRGERGGQAPALRFRRKLILKILLILSILLQILLISCSS